MLNNQWCESDHPRDEKGQFTYKNGGVASNNKMTSERMAQILYGESYAREKQEQEEKDSLLKELGKYLTWPEIMYATVEYLR